MPGNYKIENVPALDDRRFLRLVNGLVNAQSTQGDVFGFWVEANEIFTARLDAIQKATELIQFETYFMTPGHRADEFAHAIADRAMSGVPVQLLLDDYGVSDMPNEYWQRLSNVGVEIRFFREFEWSNPFQYNHRNHRKLLLIDGKIALIGGAGISDYWDGKPDIGDTAPWLDFEVGYQGAIVDLLQGHFLKNWAYVGGTLRIDRAMVSDQNTNDQNTNDTALYITSEMPSLSESSIRLLFQLSILAAQKRVWIASPYFIPDENICRALIQAVNNGVDVRILTMSEKTDKSMIYFAARELYGNLLKAGVQIWEYQPSMLHAKAALVDNTWVTVGSANFDPRSYFHNDELNVSTRYPLLIQSVDRLFTNAFNKSRCISYSAWCNRPFIQKLRGHIALLFQNLM